MIATIKSEVPTGRSMKIRDGFMSRSGLLVGLRRTAGVTAVVGLATTLRPITLRRLAAAPGLGSRRRHRISVGRRRGHRSGSRAWTAAGSADLGAVAQPVGAVDDHLVADLEAVQDLL